jgi:hypothetical protein
MRISYNVTGKARKALVVKVAEALGAEMRYKGAPTFAYEAGGYSVDKDGTLTGADDKGLVATLAAQGFTADAEDYDGEISGASLTLEYPLEGFNPDTLDNLAKMVAAKEALIKAALGADDLPIKVGKETVSFPWFTLADAGDAAYYVQFVYALCRTAKKKKRVTAKIKDADNPKYAMRCWLLSLGLIGDEFKAARKLLLKNLDGNSSFKGGSRPAYTAACFTYPNGVEGEAMDCDTEDFTSLAKAKAHVDAFAEECEGIRFAGAHVEDGNGKYVYELLCD